VSIIVSGAHGTSVQIGEIAIVHWNVDRTECTFWLKGNHVPFYHFTPRADDKVRTGEIDESEPLVARIVVVHRSSLEIMRKRFPA